MGVNQDVGAYATGYTLGGLVNFFSLSDTYTSSGVISLSMTKPEGITVIAYINNIPKSIIHNTDTDTYVVTEEVEATDELRLEFVGVGEFAIDFNEFDMGGNLNTILDETFNGGFDADWNYNWIVPDFITNSGSLTWDYDYPGSGTGWTTVYLMTDISSVLIDDLYLNCTTIVTAGLMGTSLKIFRDDTYLNATHFTIDDATAPITIDETALGAGFIKVSDYINPNELYGYATAIGFCRHYDMVAS